MQPALRTSDRAPCVAPSLAGCTTARQPGRHAKPSLVHAGLAAWGSACSQVTKGEGAEAGREPVRLFARPTGWPAEPAESPASAQWLGCVG